jgi:metal-responsive CopG/Arc/MetJ family transcriptional regulator
MDSDKETRVIVTMSPDLLDLIDDWRYSHRIPTRSEAVRQMLQIAAATQRPAKSRKA